MFGGVDRFDRETGTWRHYRHDPGDPGSLSADWSRTFTETARGCSGLEQAVDWIGLNQKRSTFTHYQADPDGPPGSPSNNVRTIDEDQAGEFWIGTKGGLYRFDREEESWSQPYRHDPNDPHSLSDDWVFIISGRPRGELWIGTIGGGLERFDPETGDLSITKTTLGTRTV